jgi:uncharacterized alkaline shock family protein YloU
MEGMGKSMGTIRVSDEVVATIAGIAAAEVKGIAGMSGGIANGISTLLTGSQLTKGVKVEVKEKEAIINLSVVVDYGTSIPDVAWQVQENVKRAVESMTGLAVSEVNVLVQGVHFESEDTKQKKT